MKINVDCCIAGGGPAGMMLGYLLARSGIKTLVLEKWPDFFRDFRGDTIHPSTMEIMHQAGILEDFLKLNANHYSQLKAEINGQQVIIADFSHLKVHCPFVAFIPQWDFLNFIASYAKKYANFTLFMNTEVKDLIEENGKIIGLRAKNSDGDIEIHTNLVVGADGRHSKVREKSGLKVTNLSAPMDVLWFRLSRKPTDPKQILGRVDFGQMMVMIDRGEYWQCGFLIRKGHFEKIRILGLSSFHKSIVELTPILSDRVGELNDWNQIKLLQVIINRLPRWYRSGLICIGDAAHAMSPIGGVGINLAIADAVASANILVPAFLNSTLSNSHLRAIQRRREVPTKIIQSMQVFIQNRLIDKVLGNPIRQKLPLLFKLLQRFSYLRRIPGFMIGMGFRPEHLKTWIIKNGSRQKAAAKGIII